MDTISLSLTFMLGMKYLLYSQPLHFSLYIVVLSSWLWVGLDIYSGKRYRFSKEFLDCLSLGFYKTMFLIPTLLRIQRPLKKVRARAEEFQVNLLTENEIV